WLTLRGEGSPNLTASLIHSRDPVLLFGCLTNPSASDRVRCFSQAGAYRRRRGR
ncbi:hypothetical protein CRENBAI_012687, partial [Crenichthys baileyi]